MTAILNGIRDVVLPEKEQQERREAIAVLEVLKLAMRAGSAALAILSFFQPHLAIALLPIAYFILEGSMVASNLQTALEDVTIELEMHFSEYAFQKNLFQNAPLCKSIYKIFRAIQD